MKKANTIISIIAIFFSVFLCAGHVLRNMGYNHIILFMIPKDASSTYYYFGLITNVIVAILCFLNIFIQKIYLKIMCLVFSFFGIRNIFAIISCVIGLKMISDERKKDIEENQPIEAMQEDSNKVLNTKDDFVTIGKRQKKMLIAGAILGILYFCVYSCFLIYLIYFKNIFGDLSFQKVFDDFGPAAFAIVIVLLVWFFKLAFALFILVFLLIPAITILVNIVVTITTLADKRYYNAKIVRVLGFISLTFFNAIAADELIVQADKNRNNSKII